MMAPAYVLITIFRRPACEPASAGKGKEARNKIPVVTFDATEPSPAVHNGACRG